MEKNVFRKTFAIGIIILFLGAGVVLGALGNNYNSMERISEGYNQSNQSNKIEYVELWAGEANVTWPWNKIPIKEIYAYPDSVTTCNLSEPSTVYIIVILKCNNEIKRNMGIPRGGEYLCEIYFDGVLQAQEQTIKCNTMIGYYEYYLGVIGPVEINNNMTLNIRIEFGIRANLAGIIPIGGWKFGIRKETIHLQIV